MDEFESLKLKYQLCFPLYAASREIIRQYRPFLDALDLTYTQYIVMLVLWEDEKISCRELGKRLFLDSGTLTPVLKSLETKGFLCRYRSSEDERVLLVEITPAGRELKKRVAGIPESMSQCVRLDAQEAAQLYRLLYKILGTAEEE